MATDVAEIEQETKEGFIRGLGLLDSTMIVAGSMIGSGIFIVSADIARQVGSPGWLLVVWIITGLLTVGAALSYGELAAMMPRAGGMYVYLKEAYGSLWGFLYGWTHFLVIGTATIAAVSIAFSRFTGILFPTLSEANYLVEPIRIGTSSYAVSLSTAQLLGILMTVLLTFMNTRGLKLGKLVQNTFTFAKTGSLIALIVLGIIVGLAWYPEIAAANFGDLWTIRGTIQNVGATPANDSASAMASLLTALGMLIAVCVAQTNSLFSADAWHNVTFTAGEVQNPKRNLPLSLLLGTGGVITLYLLANIAYLVTLRFEDIQKVASDRVGSATADVIFPGAGAVIMAVAIMISTFGCNNGLIIAGARAYYAMAKDGLFFSAAGTLNKFHVPAWAIVIQGILSVLYVLPRTVNQAADGKVTYGNLYGDLLTYVISAALIFYILAIAAIFVLRVKQPDAERPYKAFGYPIIPALYCIGAAIILVVLFVYQTTATWPGLLIVLTGVPVYFIWRSFSSKQPQAEQN